MSTRLEPDAATLPEPTPKLGRMAECVAQELTVVALILFASDALAHLRLGVWQIAAGCIGWIVVQAIVRRLLIFNRINAAIIFGAEALLLIAVFSLVKWAPGPGGMTMGQAVYVGCFLKTVLLCWRTWLSHIGFINHYSAAEGWRIIFVVGAAVWVALPFFTEHFLGGTDARWYISMLQDYLEQKRAGIFPVVVGQGSHAWNGSVHLFRSAPVYMGLAGVWDFVTLRELSASAVQHLVAITGALVAALTMYFGNSTFFPRQRWLAAAVAMMYVSSPIFLHIIYLSEMYMTWMAIALLPWVMVANAKVLEKPAVKEFIFLGAALSLLWMCHPPVALLTSYAVAAIQIVRLTLVPSAQFPWPAIAAGAVSFGLLSAGYFGAMSEIPRKVFGGDLFSQDVLQFGSFALFLAAVGWGFVGSKRRWLMLIIPALALGYRVSGSWNIWLGGSFMLLAVVWFFARSVLRRDHPAKALFLILGVLSLVAILVQWQGKKEMGLDFIHHGVITQWRANVGALENFVMPQAKQNSAMEDMRPGLGLLVGFVGMLVVAVRGRAVVPAVFLWVSLPLLLLFLPVPLLSEFNAENAPPGMANLTGLGMSLRTLPTLCALLAVGGFCALAARAERSRRARTLILVSAFALVLINLQAGWHYVRQGWSVTMSRALMSERFRPENELLAAFAYDLLPIPDYYSHNPMDPRLEIRLLDADGKILVDQGTIAQTMESFGRDKIVLTAGPYEPVSPGWWSIAPGFTVEPQQTRLLRFEFDPAINYSGWLFLRSEHGYREYHLPESGQRLAFGAGPQSSRILAVSNSGNAPEHWILFYRGEPGGSVPPIGKFAEVTLSSLTARDSPIRLQSYLPLEVEATASAPGFIETPRVWLPGYRALIDGQVAPISRSAQGLIAVPINPGTHLLNLAFVGTARLWVTTLLSLATWITLIIWTLWNVSRRYTLRFSPLG